jgi:hypothetical protein
MNKTALAIVAALCTSIALADDFKTIDGKEYKNAKVSRVEPDGIVLITESGISKVYFVELPKEVQERFHYDAQKAAEFTSETKNGIDQFLHQRADANARAAETATELAAEYEQRQGIVREQAEQKAAKQQRQADAQRPLASTPSISQEGIPEHTYELLQDYIVNMGAWRKRLRRGERYHGRILVDHAELDIDGISYIVPSGILSLPKD